jgi:hypothetical protein
MSGKWKAEWYDRFCTLVRRGQIKVLHKDNYIDGGNKDFLHQARNLRIRTKTPDGRNLQYPLYHHRTEKDKDDILDSIVGCLSLIDEDMVSHGNMMFFEAGKEEEKVEDEDMFETANRLNNRSRFNLWS